MTRGYHFFHGLRSAIPLCIYITKVLIKSWGYMNPKEPFSGKKPQVGHFRIFGCLTYSHVPKERRTKLEPTTEKDIFVGYTETLKAYHLYIPTLRTIVVKWDVKFEEER